MSVSPLSVSNSSLKVMNAALAQIGVEEITSFSDSTQQAKVGNRLFADILENALASYPWRFARDRVVLVRNATTAPPPWTGCYTIPNSTVTLLTVYEGNHVCSFDRFGSNIVVNANAGSTSVFAAEITASVTPDLWSGAFRRAFILQLAASIAMPITQDEQTAGFLNQEAERMMLRARSRDAQGRTPSRLDTKMFVKARRTHRM